MDEFVAAELNDHNDDHADPGGASSSGNGPKDDHADPGAPSSSGNGPKDDHADPRAPSSPANGAKGGQDRPDTSSSSTDGPKDDHDSPGAPTSLANDPKDGRVDRDARSFTANGATAVPESQPTRAKGNYIQPAIPLNFQQRLPSHDRSTKQDAADKSTENVFGSFTAGAAKFLPTQQPEHHLGTFASASYSATSAISKPSTIIPSHEKSDQ
ncbi:MAG: hypothetical protein Q9180_005982 [Flavoplaca navasiana]